MGIPTGKASLQNSFCGARSIRYSARPTGPPASPNRDDWMPSSPAHRPQNILKHPCICCHYGCQHRREQRRWFDRELISTTVLLPNSISPWRRGPELNRRIELLQSSALPLGYRAKPQESLTLQEKKPRASAEIKFALPDSPSSKSSDVALARPCPPCHYLT